MMDKNAKIYVAGHTGLVGSSLVERLKAQGNTNLLLRTHEQLDLTRQQDTEAFFQRERPDYVLVAAAKVGGIRANSEAPADFFYQNMQIATNVLWSAFQNNVKKLLYLGSACMYPRLCEQPMQEENLLTGIPEPTNEAYALAKVGGCRFCSYLHRQYGAPFISAIPANAYGPNDSFDPLHSHVIPALIRKYHLAKVNQTPSVELWGSGKVLREFIFTDDLADGCLFLMDHYDSDQEINMGTGEEVSMWELSKLVAHVVGYEGETVCDPSKPDGMPRRMVDSTRLEQLGWWPRVSLEEGIARVYQVYQSRQA